MSYGPSFVDLHRRSADHVAAHLKEKLAKLASEQQRLVTLADAWKGVISALQCTADYLIGRTTLNATRDRFASVQLANLPRYHITLRSPILTARSAAL